jgi:galactitol PTS system EIIB component
MAGKLKIKVGCGSGLATATVAAEAVRNICKKANIDADVTTCRVTDLRQYDDDASIDILLSTSKINEDQFEKPIMSVFGLISGINEDQITARLIKIMKEIQNNRETLT